MLRVWLALATTIPALITTVTLVVTSGAAPSTSQSTQPTTVQSASLPQLKLNRGVRPAAKSGITLPPESATLAANDSGYRPREEVYLADPSNYDRRVAVDAQGTPVDNDYIVVLHETVGTAMSAINTFQTNHPNDYDQVSYHALITGDGTVVYMVPPEQRAFGAGNSVFISQQGEEAVTTNAEFPSSVNNFAYHISLETPADGRNNANAAHSGYTAAQYQSLAWLISRSTIPEERITTHKQVDRSGARSDPRSFEPERLFRFLRQYR